MQSLQSENKLQVVITENVYKCCYFVYIYVVKADVIDIFCIGLEGLIYLKLSILKEINFRNICYSM